MVASALDKMMAETFNRMLPALAVAVVAQAVSLAWQRGRRERRHIPQFLAQTPVWLLSPKGIECGQWPMAQAQRIVKKTGAWLGVDSEATRDPQVQREGAGYFYVERVERQEV